jgi:hypothetical protein
METMQHPKAIVTFEQSILWIKFNNGIEIDATDMNDIYEFANEQSKGGPFCVLFDAAGTNDLKEEVVTYVAKNPGNFPIRAKAYVMGSPDHETKIKLHMAFDKPQVKPGIFTSKKEAVSWLQTFLKQ